MTRLLDHLRARQADGRKLLVPYVMAGLPQPDTFAATVAAVARDADALEIGLPYSDPLMDGPVIASAAERALQLGVGPLSSLEMIGHVEGGVPRVVMTYYNPIHRIGESEFAKRLLDARVDGVIVPDLPMEESEELQKVLVDAGVGWIPLVAPTSSAERVERIVAGATGFVYAVSTLGVTGERTSLSARAAAVVERCRAATDLPVVVGIGISTPEQAREAARVADGVVIGSAVVRLVLEEGADAAGGFLGRVRAALDAG